MFFLTSDGMNVAISELEKMKQLTLVRDSVDSVKSTNWDIPNLSRQDLQSSPTSRHLDSSSE